MSNSEINQKSLSPSFFLKALHNLICTINKLVTSNKLSLCMLRVTLWVKRHYTALLKNLTIICYSLKSLQFLLQGTRTREYKLLIIIGNWIKHIIRYTPNHNLNNRMFMQAHLIIVPVNSKTEHQVTALARTAIFREETKSTRMCVILAISIL